MAADDRLFQNSRAHGEASMVQAVRYTLSYLCDEEEIISDHMEEMIRKLEDAEVQAMI
jgi:hypothetical protein